MLEDLLIDYLPVSEVIISNINPKDFFNLICVNKNLYHNLASNTNINVLSKLTEDKDDILIFACIRLNLEMTKHIIENNTIINIDRIKTIFQKMFMPYKTTYNHLVIQYHKTMIHAKKTHRKVSRRRYINEGTQLVKQINDMQSKIDTITSIELKLNEVPLITPSNSFVLLRMIC